MDAIVVDPALTMPKAEPLTLADIQRAMAAIDAEPYRPTFSYGTRPEMAAWRASVVASMAVRRPDRFSLYRDLT